MVIRAKSGASLRGSSDSAAPNALETAVSSEQVGHSEEKLKGWSPCDDAFSLYSLFRWQRFS
jgi:hypothetical protein